MSKLFSNRISHNWEATKQPTYPSNLSPTDVTSPMPYSSLVRYLGIVFDKSLTFTNHITLLSCTCCWRSSILDYKTAYAIATSIVHSKLVNLFYLFDQWQGVKFFCVLDQWQEVKLICVWPFISVNLNYVLIIIVIGQCSRVHWTLNMAFLCGESICNTSQQSLTSNRKFTT